MKVDLTWIHYEGMD